LSLYFKANRDRYYDLLQGCDWRGLGKLAAFFLEGVLETSEQAVTTAQQIQRLLHRTGRIE
jgi:hypothetical protein